MLLYHGSSKNELNTLQPFTANHGKPYVYFSTSEIAAAFFAASPVQRPYYWFRTILTTRAGQSIRKSTPEHFPRLTGRKAAAFTFAK